MDWAANLDAAAFGAVVAAASGVLVPRIIERVPEPEPEQSESDGPESDGPESRGPESRGPESRWPESAASEAAAASNGAGSNGAGSNGAGSNGAGSNGAGSNGARDAETEATAEARVASGPRFEGASEPEEEPKETYFAIADRPGLLWKCVLAALVTGGLIGVAVGWDWALLFLLPLVPVSLALTVIDWRTKLLPTWLIARTYVGLIALVLVATLITQDWDDLVRAGIGWAGAGLLFFVLWYIHPRGLGYGDVRLSGILGIALGWVGTAELVVGVYAAFLLGGVGGALLSMLRIVHRKGFPFGPFMFVGALVGLLFGDWVAGLTTL